MWNFFSNDIVCSNAVKQFAYKLKGFDLSSFIRGRAFTLQHVARLLLYSIRMQIN